MSIHDKRSEGKLTGTGVLSYKPVENLLLYASYSRGYKAGGFNLDRSALKSPTVRRSPAYGGAQALVGNLQFDPETVDAFELGGKFSRRGILLNVAVFRQQFKNFQLNTFDGIGVHRPEHQRLQLEPERARPRPELQSGIAQLHPAGDRCRLRVQHQSRGEHGRLPA